MKRLVQFAWIVLLTSSVADAADAPPSGSIVAQLQAPAPPVSVSPGAASSVSVSPGATSQGAPRRERTSTPGALGRRALPASAVAGGNPPEDCETLQRRYLESQACFARYRLANGGLKAEASRRCTSVRDPSPRCGLPKLK